MSRNCEHAAPSAMYSTYRQSPVSAGRRGVQFPRSNLASLSRNPTPPPSYPSTPPSAVPTLTPLAPSPSPLPRTLVVARRQSPPFQPRRIPRVAPLSRPSLSWPPPRTPLAPRGFSRPGAPRATSRAWSAREPGSQRSASSLASPSSEAGRRRKGSEAGRRRRGGEAERRARARAGHSQPGCTPVGSRGPERRFGEGCLA